MSTADWIAAGWVLSSPAERQRDRERQARITVQRAAANQQHVREQVEQRDPALARALGALFSDLPERQPRQQRETRGSR